MVVIDMHLKIGTIESFSKAADAGGLLTVDDDQAGDVFQTNVLGAGKDREVVGVLGDKIAHPLFLGTGEGKQRAGIEPQGRHHGAEAVEIGIYVGGDDIHRLT